MSDLVTSYYTGWMRGGARLQLFTF